VTNAVTPTPVKNQSTLLRLISDLSPNQLLTYEALSSGKRTTTSLTSVKWDDGQIAMVNTNILSKESLSKKWHKQLKKTLSTKLCQHRSERLRASYKLPQKLCQSRTRSQYY